MNKKRKIIITIVLILILVVVCIVAFQPRPVVPKQDNLTIGYILLITNEGRDSVLVEGYDEKEILSYLQTCTERRTLERAQTYLRGYVDLEIYIHNTGSGKSFSKDILLGEINYSYTDWGRAKFRINDAEQVKSELMEMLGIDSQDIT